MVDVLEKAGLFWWHNEVYSRRRYAPPSAVAGTLRIGADGIAALRLQGRLKRPARSNAMGDLLSQKAPRQDICGFLIESGQTVYLKNVIINGGRVSSYAPATESFLAYRCLVYQSAIMLEKSRHSDRWNFV